MIAHAVQRYTLDTEGTRGGGRRPYKSKRLPNAGKRLPNAALHGHIVEGKRSRGRQRKTWMDNIREDLKEKNIDLTRIGEATRNIEIWRNILRASSSAR